MDDDLKKRIREIVDEFGYVVGDDYYKGNDTAVDNATNAIMEAITAVPTTKEGK